MASGKFQNCVGDYKDTRCQFPDARELRNKLI